jgi:hypothetical protein
VTEEVLGQVATETSTAAAWHAIMRMFLSQSQARIVHLFSMLSSLWTGELTRAAYYAQMKGFVDEMQ